MKTILVLLACVVGLLLGGCNCGNPGGPDGGPDASFTGIPPPQLMLAAGTGSTPDGGTRLIVNFGQPLVKPFSVSGDKKIAPGTFPQTTVK